MHTSTRSIDVCDAEQIVREIDFPAMQSGPLYRLMFPTASEFTESQQDEVIRWYSDSLRDAITGQTTSFLQICAPDGSPLGFCGWRIEPPCQATDESTTRPAGSETAGLQSRRRDRSSLPETLDIDTWVSISQQLRKERERVLNDTPAIYRLTFMSVRPDRQRQGLGSCLLKAVCDKIDEAGLPGFVMASPDGVRLYAKFGFRMVGRVVSHEGTFSSMLRPARATM
ncbi:hypothetical protein F4859DRAFT_491716 [Xylaria cf. heliscus]|nr:hypothetical protein F4859DRAFT_491716 [Xylaria cf. heliscus]